MGLNMIMLYAEDSYEIKEEPYFGYMRGRYREDDLRTIDRFAAHIGIEAIPCIQTLAHLADVLQWAVYDDIKEDEDTLLPAEEKTYAFIERMITAAAAPFTSRRIHIGMDEVWRLGQGRYLKIHGWRKKIDIMTEHLSRVLQITDRLGLRPMIWSDMYFRAASKTGDYYDRESTFDLAARVSDLRHDHRDLWLSLHQPFGWEVMDLRYGALLMRIDTARLRLEDYLTGRLDSIPELERERLPWQGREGVADLICNSYDRIVSASRLAYSYKM